MKKIHITERSLRENFNEDLEPMSELEKNLNGIENPSNYEGIEDGGNEFDMYGRNQNDDYDDFSDLDDTPLDMDSVEWADDERVENDDNEIENDNIPHQEEIDGVENLGVIDDDDEEIAKKVIKNYLRDARDNMMEIVDFLTHSDYAHIGDEAIINKRLDKAYAIYDEIKSFFKDE